MDARRRLVGCRCGQHRGGGRRAAFRRLSKKVDDLAQLLAASMAGTSVPANARAFRGDRQAPRSIGEAIARIVGGVPVSPGAYPECVLVGRRRRPRAPIGWFCSGVLVHPRLVLTAAHCFDPSHPANVVALNAEDQDDLSHAELRGVRRMVRHPQYPQTGLHDIAVMVLGRDATVAPVRLAVAEELSQAQETTLVGFGNDDVLSTRGFGIKREVTVPILRPGADGGNTDEAEQELELGSTRISSSLPAALGSIRVMETAEGQPTSKWARSASSPV